MSVSTHFDFISFPWLHIDILKPIHEWRQPWTTCGGRSGWKGGQSYQSPPVSRVGGSRTLALVLLSMVVYMIAHSLCDVCSQ